MSSGDFNIGFTPATDKFIKRFKKKLDKKNMAKALDVEMQRIGDSIVAKIRQFSLSAGNPIIFPNRRQRSPLGQRSGALSRGVEARKERRDGFPSVRVGIFKGPATKYAGILDHGGTITPKRARALKIPGPGGSTASGLDNRFSGDLTFIPFRNKSKLIGKLVDKARADALPSRQASRLQAVYFLAAKVKIPAFGWLSKPVKAEIPFVVTEISDFMRGYLSEI